MGYRHTRSTFALLAALALAAVKVTALADSAPGLSLKMSETLSPDEIRNLRLPPASTSLGTRRDTARKPAQPAAAAASSAPVIDPSRNPAGQVPKP